MLQQCKAPPYVPIKASAGDSCDELPEILRERLIFERGMFPPKAITHIPHAMKCLCSGWKVNPASPLPLMIKMEGHSREGREQGLKEDIKTPFSKDTHSWNPGDGKETHAWWMKMGPQKREGGNPKWSWLWGTTQRTNGIINKRRTHYQNHISLRFYQMPSHVHQEDKTQFSAETQNQLLADLWEQHDFKKYRLKKIINKKVTDWFGPQHPLISDDTEQGNNTLQHSHFYGDSTHHALWLAWVLSQTSSNEQSISGVSETFHVCEWK